MKRALILTAALLVSMTAVAKDGDPARTPNTSDFTQAYLDQIQTEKTQESTSAQAQREHMKFLRDSSRRDRASKN